MTIKQLIEQAMRERGFCSSLKKSPIYRQLEIAIFGKPTGNLARQLENFYESDSPFVKVFQCLQIGELILFKSSLSTVEITEEQATLLGLNGEDVLIIKVKNSVK